MVNISTAIKLIFLLVSTYLVATFPKASADINIDRRQTPVATPATCGTRPTSSSSSRKRGHNVHNKGKIVQGFSAGYGDIPWQVRVTRDKYHVCGGTIISEYWILTAAHCLVATNIYQVLVGDLDGRVTEQGQQAFNVDLFFIHEHYNTPRHNNDIALLRLAPKNGKGIQFNRYVQPACLPDTSTPFTEGTKCLISGWGSNIPDQGMPIHTLLAAEIGLLSYEKCVQMWGAKITKNMLCAGSVDGGSSPCVGDSGGPLVCKIGETYTSFGIVSWGPRICGQPYVTSVFTRVSQLLDWILPKIKLNSDTSSKCSLPFKP